MTDAVVVGSGPNGLAAAVRLARAGLSVLVLEGADELGPLLRMPSHPLAMARLGLRAGLPATAFARLFRTEPARALFMGCAAHLFRPLNGLASSSVGTMMIAAGHRWGWPVAEGGSSAISRALAGLLESLGGQIVTGVTVRSLADVPRATITMFDTTPEAVADITGDRLPPRRARAYRRFRHAPAAFKADFAVREGIPWRDEHARRAGTVHLGGTAADIARSDTVISRGDMPEHTFQLIGQQYLADHTRSVGDVHPIWTYAHVPHGYTGDASELLLDQSKRWRRGFAIASSHGASPRRRVSRTTTRTTSAVTSSEDATICARCSPGRSWRGTPTPPAYRECTSARRRHRPGRERTECAATTRRRVH